MGKYLLVLFSFLFLSVTGCGPSSTARDNEDAQSREVVKRRKAVLAPVAGYYAGTIYDMMTKQTINVFVQLFPASIMQPIANQNSFEEVPTLNGYVGGSGGGMTYTVFSYSVFDEKTGHLQAFSGIAGGGGSSGGTPTGPMAQNQLDVQFDGNSLVGHYLTPNKFFEIKVTKAKRP